MRVNIDNLKLLMNKVANDNYNEFARLLDIDVGYLHKVMNCKCGAGKLFFSKLIEYCKENSLDFNQYIFLI